MFGTLLGMFQCLSILVTPHEHSFHTSLPEDPAFARLLRYKWSGGLFTLSCVLKPLELLPGALHVRKRSQGGSDFDLDWLVSLCRVCHAQTDAPYVTGRLVVTPLGSGRFEWAVVYAHSKRDVPNSQRLPMAHASRMSSFAHVGKLDSNTPGTSRVRELRTRTRDSLIKSAPQ